MGKSDVGPDMRDCFAYLKEIEKGTGSAISILVDVVGSSVGWTGHIHALALSRELTPEGPLWSCGASVYWPHRNYKTFEGAVFDLLLLLDVSVEQKSFLRALDITA